MFIGINVLLSLAYTTTCWTCTTYFFRHLDIRSGFGRRVLKCEICWNHGLVVACNQCRSPNPTWNIENIASSNFNNFYNAALRVMNLLAFFCDPLQKHVCPQRNAKPLLGSPLGSPPRPLSTNARVPCLKCWRRRFRGLPMGQVGSERPWVFNVAQEQPP